MNLFGERLDVVMAVCSRHWPSGSEAGLLAVVDSVLAITLIAPTFGHEPATLERVNA